MSWSILLGGLWAVAAMVTAMLPYRAQFPPGIALLVAAPFLIGFLGYEHGILAGILALAAFASMFRRPLFFLARWVLRRLGASGE